MAESIKQIKVAVIGAAGRMGRTLVGEILSAKERFSLVGALEISTSPALGVDVAGNAGYTPIGVIITDDPFVALKDAEVAIDFSAPSAIGRTAAAVKELRCPTLLATTALTEADQALCKEVSQVAPLLASPNFSLGIYALRRAVKETARLLADKGFEAELLEIHHHHKKDAPSGTAKLLIKELLESGIATAAVYDRASAPALREADTLGVSVLRGGDVAGEHTVYFFGQGERLELTHEASSAALFPKGALKAAEWLVRQPAGLYSMDDFFGA